MLFFGDVVAAFPGHFAGRVLDIGSLDINGGPHTLFTSAEYVGVDLGSGPNVTHVGRGEDLTLPDGRFDVAMSSECFEHNRAWRATVSNMIRMTRRGGLVVFTAASTGRAEHGTTRSDQGRAAPLAVAIGEEWYRNLTTRDVITAVADVDWANRFCLELRSTSDLLFAGIIGPASATEVQALHDVEAKWRTAARESRYPGTWVRRAILETTGDRGLRVAKTIRGAATSYGAGSRAELGPADG